MIETNDKTTNKTAVSCKSFREQIPDLLLEPNFAAAHPELELHMAACAACAPCHLEVTELRSTMGVLDLWEAPEPTPYFDSRLHARLREVQAEAPAGFWERMTSFFRYSSNASLRPALAGGLALLLLAGGGTFAGFYPLHTDLARPPAASATVNDLQRLDNNAQTLLQMNQLLEEGSDDANADQPTT